MKSYKLFLLIPVIILFAASASTQTKAEPAAKPKVVTQEQFFIVGIEARTTAAKESTDQGVIPQQWQTFMQQGVLQRIPNKADENIYVVYTDFVNKRAGEYSVVIGAKVSDKGQVPAGMVAKTVPAGKYALFQSDRGEAWQVVPAAWQKISDAEDHGTLGYVRSYQADYEVYSGPALDPANVLAHVFVGVK